MEVKWLRKLKDVVKYIVYLAILIFILDVVILRSLLGVIYPKHFSRSDQNRYPVPYIMFSGKPALPHNEFGFKAKPFSQIRQESYKIAFWGGSTGYTGNPPIPDMIEQKLAAYTGIDVEVINFSIMSSNHRQHLHGMLEYHHDFVPDLVIFYGGYNETIQQGYYDPRPGYPYNYFYRSQLSDLQRIALTNSAILTVIEANTHRITGLHQLREWWDPFSENWNRIIIEKYFETLELAKGVAATIDTSRFGQTQFIAFYQPYQVPEVFASSHNAIRTRITSIDYVHDVSTVYDSMPVKPYTDIVHVNQEAREKMAVVMTNVILRVVIPQLPPDESGSPTRITKPQ